MQTLNKAFKGEAELAGAPRDPEKNKKQRTAAKRWSTRRQLASNLFVLILLVVLVLTYLWASRTGRLDVWSLQIGQGSDAYLARAGFSADQINTNDPTRTSISDLHQALGAYDGQSLSALQPHAIAQRLEQLPWVATASVQRDWPNTLNIWIEEHQPMAVLHRPDGPYALGFAGDVITAATPDLVANLPNVAGEGAELAAQSLLLGLSQYPEISQRFVGATRMGNRRWNLYLEPGIEIRLPESGERAALQTLQDMARFNDIFNKELAAIDLRTERPIILR